MAFFDKNFPEKVKLDNLADRKNGRLLNPAETAYALKNLGLNNVSRLIKQYEGAEFSSSPVKLDRKKYSNLSCSVLRDKWNNVYAIYHENILGEGGFGKVKIAQNIKTGEWVAIKVQKTIKDSDISQIEQEESLLDKVQLLKGTQSREVQVDNQAKYLKKYTIQPLLKGKPVLEAIGQEPKIDPLVSSLEGFIMNRLKSSKSDSTESLALSSEGGAAGLGTFVPQDTFAPQNTFQAKTHKSGQGLFFQKLLNASPEEQKKIREAVEKIDNVHEIDVLNDFPVNRFLEAASKIAESLKKLHDVDVIHCDIKSDNILMDPKTLEATFIDFGISHHIPKNEKYVNAVAACTKDFAAPEVVEGLYHGSMCNFGKDTDIATLSFLFQAMLLGRQDDLPRGKILFRDSDHDLKREELVKSLNEVSDLIQNMKNPDRNKRPDISEVIDVFKKIQLKLPIKNEEIIKDKVENSPVNVKAMKAKFESLSNISSNPNKKGPVR